MALYRVAPGGVFRGRHVDDGLGGVFDLVFLESLLLLFLELFCVVVLLDGHGGRGVGLAEAPRPGVGVPGVQILIGALGILGAVVVVVQVHGARVRLEVAGVYDRDPGYDDVGHLLGGRLFSVQGTGERVVGLVALTLQPGAGEQVGPLPGHVAVAAALPRAPVGGSLVLGVGVGGGSVLQELELGLEEGGRDRLGLLLGLTETRGDRAGTRTVHAVRGVGIMLEGSSMQEVVCGR